MPLQPKLTKFSTASPNIISYNWTDVANKTGYITFYMVDDTTNNILSVNPYDSQDYFTQLNFAVAGIALRNTTTWAYTLTRPMDIEGDFVFRASVQQEVGADKTLYGRIDIKIIHYDGTTATTLIDSTGNQKNWVGDVNPNGVVLVNKNTIPLKHFQKGDVLRVEVETYLGSSGAGFTAKFKLWHDGANKNMAGVVAGTTASLPTQMKIDTPFKIE